MLKNQKISYKALAENFPNGAIILFDEEMRLTMVEGKELDKRGFPKQVIEGKFIKDVIADDVAANVLPQFAKVFSGEDVSFEVQGHEGYYQIKALPVKSSTGKIESGMAIIYDISKDKAESKKLIEMNDNKDKFFSIIAHDLKTPFQSLIAFTSILEEDIESLNMNEIKSFAHSLNTSAKNVYALLENLLQWSRIQSGNVKVEADKVSLATIVENTLNLYRMNAADKELILINAVDNEVEVLADMNILLTIFRNLLSNAIKFSKRGGIIRIYSTNINGMTEVIVEDTGVGMRQEKIDKLFKIQEQVTTTGTEGETGTGLGLHITKDFVELSGGTIRIESQYGKGTKFIFTLPAAV